LSKVQSLSWDEDEEPAKIEAFQQFATILREGPDLGVHVVAWCDTYSNLNRTLQRRDINEFDMRVVFQMNSEDSTNLIDTPMASKLGPHRAILLDEYTGHIEKFRPYGLPQEKWLALVQKQLNYASKTGGEHER